MRELTFVDPTRLIKFNETDSQKVDFQVMMMENVGWNPNLPCVVINRADALLLSIVHTALRLPLQWK